MKKGNWMPKDMRRAMNSMRKIVALPLANELALGPSFLMRRLVNFETFLPAERDSKKETPRMGRCISTYSPSQDIQEK